MAYGDFKYLARRTASDEFYKIKHLILLKILNMMGIKDDLLLWLINFLIKSRKMVVLLIMRLNKINKSTSFGLGCTLISWRVTQTNYKKFLKKIRSVYSGSEDNIWGTDLADI